jgi:hypothetical protein
LLHHAVIGRQKSAACGIYLARRTLQTTRLVIENVVASSRQQPFALQAATSNHWNDHL